MTTYFRLATRPQPERTDRQLLCAAIDARKRADELTNTLIGIARAGAGVEKPKPNRCPDCGGRDFLPVYAGDHTESRLCPTCHPLKCHICGTRDSQDNPVRYPESWRFHPVPACLDEDACTVRLDAIMDAVRAAPKEEEL